MQDESPAPINLHGADARNQGAFMRAMGTIGAAAQRGENVVDLAKAIVVRKQANTDVKSLQSFLESYEPGENPVTRVLVWDHRVIVTGHSANKAACIAISAAVQTAAAIGRSIQCVQSVELYATDKTQEPVYDIVFLPGRRSRKVIGGLMASFMGIAKTSEGDNPGSAMLVSDHRKIKPQREVSFGKS